MDDADSLPAPVEPRPTPLPSVDGALLGLSVRLLADLRQTPRSFCPPPHPPSTSRTHSFGDWSRADWYDDYQVEDSSISLMERIEGVPRPISACPAPQPEPTERRALRSHRRKLVWLGVAAGVVHCMVLALVLSAPEVRSIADESAPATRLVVGAEAPAPVNAAPVRGAAQRPAREPAALDTARAGTRRLRLAHKTRSKRHQVASLRSASRKRRHAPAMRRSRAPALRRSATRVAGSAD